jgi:hypothetical protein
MRVIYSAKFDNHMGDFDARLLPICCFRQLIYLGICAQVVLGRLKMYLKCTYTEHHFSRSPPFDFAFSHGNHRARHDTSCFLSCARDSFHSRYITVCVFTLD